MSITAGQRPADPAAGSAKADVAQDEQNDNDKANNPDQTVHGFSPICGSGRLLPERSTIVDRFDA
ncbi:MAG: hypothetical protein ABIN96_18030 [Rubrivivax sp.]